MSGLIYSLRQTLKGKRKLNERRKYRACGIVLAIVHFLFAALFFALNVWSLFYYNVAVVAFYSFIAVITGRTYRFTNIFIATFVEVLFHSMLASIMLGWEWGFMTYTLGLVPLSFYITYTVPYFKQNMMIPMISSAIVAVCFFFVRVYTVYEGPILPAVHASEALEGRVYLFNVLLTISFLLIVSVLFSLEVYYMQHNLEDENVSLEQLANYDPLTKLLNRRSMDSFLMDAADKAVNGNDKFCLIMADIDDFKKVNDTYGHAIGDQVLVKVAEIISHDVREGDCVCRWGGEEILVLIRSSAETAEFVAERICKDIAAARIDTGSTKIAITLTLGVAQYRNGETVDSVVERADACMYTGKSRGKNQVVMDHTRKRA